MNGLRGNTRPVEPGPINVNALVLNKAALAAMEPIQLHALIDAFQTVDDVLAGLCSQPRLNIGAGRFNAAGEELAALSDWLTGAKASIVAAARARPDRQTATDAGWLRWVTVAYEANYLESFAGLAVVVTQAAHAEENADG